ncbi:MAG TPA: hypothetical protein VMT95_14280 [Candidatus Binatia bacterium]|nr:hypothetical protein [Candidatus Binatia bacterium]
MLRFASAALVATLAATGTAALAATTPKPSASPHAAHTPSIHLPNVPLHTEVVVEVNKKGQVVRVKSTKQSSVRTFNLQTIGNAEQMWIRRPDGTAQVGLYRVTYDYDPKTQQVSRHVALISAGGSWGDQPGAATVMINLAHKQAVEQAKYYQEQQKKQQEQNAKLPTLNQIRGVQQSPSPKSATLPP